MSCVACYVFSSPNIIYPELKAEQWKYIIKNLQEAGASTVYILGGEPTLRRDLGEIVRFSSGLGMKVAISTNGFAVTHEYSEELRDAGLTEAQVSIDSPDERINDELRGPGSLKAAISAIANFRSSGIRVTISTTVSDKNYMHVKGIMALGERLGVEAINFIAVQRFGRAKAAGLLLTPKNARSVINELLDYNGKLKVTANGFRFFLSLNEVVKADLGGTISCPAGESYITIGPDGSVYGCDLLMVLGKKAGNALTRSIKDVLASGFSELKDRRSLTFQPCSSCPIRNSCQAGCAARALQSYGTFFAKDPLCNYWEALR